MDIILHNAENSLIRKKMYTLQLYKGILKNPSYLNYKQNFAR